MDCAGSDPERSRPAQVQKEYKNIKAFVSVQCCVNQSRVWDQEFFFSVAKNDFHDLMMME